MSPFFILLTRVFFFLLSILYGVILSMIWESVLFYLLLSLVRGYAGGIHASREWICTTCTSLTLLVGVLLINWFSKWDSIMVPIVILVVGAAVIGLVCPIDSAEKPAGSIRKEALSKDHLGDPGGITGSIHCIFVGNVSTIITHLCNCCCRCNCFSVVGKNEREKKAESVQDPIKLAYCLNNPVNRTDCLGNWSLPNWAKVAIGAVAIVGLAVATVCTGGAAAVICGAALSGAIAGGTSGAVIGAVSGGITGGWQGALDGACSGFMTGTIVGGATGAAAAGFNIATGITTVEGSAHGSALHKLATNMEAGKMAASGQYSSIGVNKSLNKMGLSGTQRPNVIGVSNNSTNKLVEVVSPRQSSQYIVSKMASMLSNNNGTVGKIVSWVRKLYK